MHYSLYNFPVGKIAEKAVYRSVSCVFIIIYLFQFHHILVIQVHVNMVARAPKQEQWYSVLVLLITRDIIAKVWNYTQECRQIIP